MRVWEVKISSESISIFLLDLLRQLGPLPTAGYWEAFFSFRKRDPLVWVIVKPQAFLLLDGMISDDHQHNQRNLHSVLDYCSRISIHICSRQPYIKRSFLIESCIERFPFNKTNQITPLLLKMIMYFDRRLRKPKSTSGFKPDTILNITPLQIQGFGFFSECLFAWTCHEHTFKEP